MEKLKQLLQSELQLQPNINIWSVTPVEPQFKTIVGCNTIEF